MKIGTPTCLSTLRRMGSSLTSSGCRNEVGESRNHHGREWEVETK
jgi:hypothetical protein